MNKINCDVSICSHNNKGVCYSNRVNIGGKGSESSCDTCCGSFLNKDTYSNLTNNTNSTGCCDALICEAENCIYNENKLCSADYISVPGNNATIYTETSCKTFKSR